ncbi:MAG: TolB family protein [Capsulimonadaceae bacterium]
MRASLVFSLFLILGTAAAAYASGDVVYSAQYYSPGAAALSSRSHLYCMSPDGSGLTQLTFGGHDDYDPRWSPDGSWIAFIREPNSLCVMRSDVKQIRTLASISYLDPSLYCWFPDSQHLLVMPDGEKAYLLDVRSRKRVRFPVCIDTISFDPSGRTACVGFHGRFRIVRIPGFHLIANLNEPLEQIAWVPPDELIGTLGDPNLDTRSIVAYSDTGRRLWIRTLRRDQNDSNAYFGAFLALYPVPGNSGLVLVEQEVSVADNDYLLLDLVTGTASHWSDLGQLFEFSPDGRTYLVSTQDRGPVRLRNGKLDGGCPLLQGKWPTDSSAWTVTHGHVEVSGFDWRGAENRTFPRFHSVRVWP